MRTILCCVSVFSAGCSDPGPQLDDSAEYFVEAQQALAEGNTQQALELLDKSIESRPDTWALYQRAKLHADQGNDEQARADCKAGLELNPDHSNLKWLAAELEKPAGQRFKGKNAEPPSRSK